MQQLSMQYTMIRKFEKTNLQNIINSTATVEAENRYFPRHIPK